MVETEAQKAAVEQKWPVKPVAAQRLKFVVVALQTENSVLVVVSGQTLGSEVFVQMWAFVEFAQTVIVSAQTGSPSLADLNSQHQISVKEYDTL